MLKRKSSHQIHRENEDTGIMLATQQNYKKATLKDIELIHDAIDLYTQADDMQSVTLWTSRLLELQEKLGEIEQTLQGLHKKTSRIKVNCKSFHSALETANKQLPIAFFYSKVPSQNQGNKENKANSRLQA